VKKFLKDFIDHFETAVLKPTEVTSEQKTAILDKFDKALEQILLKTLAVDFGKGRAVANIPLVHRAYSLRKIFKSDDDLISDFIRKLIRRPSKVLPPVDATALILGSTHYVTFDGKLDRFEKTCQYLLASDFVGRNFTVSIDLGDGSRSSYNPTQSLTITDDKTTVSLGSREVFVNGRLYDRVPSPTTVGAFRLREESGWFIVSGDMGVTVGCTINIPWNYGTHLCAIQLSGFYHGKVQGVLGQYDNELKDEYKLPTGQVTENSGVFLKSWKLNKACPAKTNGRDELIPVLSEAYKNQKLDIDTFFSDCPSSPHRKLRHDLRVDDASSGASSSRSVAKVVIVGMTGVLLLISILAGYFGL